MKKLYFIIIYTVLFALLSKWIYDHPEYPIPGINKGGKEMVIKNYGKIIAALAPKFHLPQDYLLALIMLESSGKKRVPVRFEKEVYQKLLLTKRGKNQGFEKVDKEKLRKFSKRDLKKLASSYGPFQIMGYKIFELNTSISELSGKNNIYWALKWIDINYGNLLRKGDYKDAFHLHNAGEKYPENGKSKTYDPEYVQKGLEYVKYFRKRIKNDG